MIILAHPWNAHRRDTCVAQLRKHTAWGDKNRLRDGLSLDVCGRHATHMVDDEPMCQVHASQEALAHVMSECLPARQRPGRSML